jgi:hypothetical protein
LTGCWTTKPTCQPSCEQRQSDDFETNIALARSQQATHSKAEDPFDDYGSTLDLPPAQLRNLRRALLEFRS